MEDNSKKEYCIVKYKTFNHRFIIEKHSITWDVVYQWVSCTVHKTHYHFDSKISTEIALFSGSHALFTRPTSLFFQQNFH